MVRLELSNILLLINRLYLIGTNDMVADMLTKATDKGTFVKMRNFSMNVNASARELLYQCVSTVHGESRSLMTRLLRRV